MIDKKIDVTDIEIVDAPVTLAEVDLFSDELEDRFNAAMVSTLATASSSSSTWSSASTYCSIF
jgi:hypothetical protein